MKLPVLNKTAPEQKKSGGLGKKLLRKRVVIPVLACALTAAFAL